MSPLTTFLSLLAQPDLRLSRLPRPACPDPGAASSHSLHAAVRRCLFVHTLQSEMRMYRATHLVDENLQLTSDSSGSWWAGTVATYCPGRMEEIPKPKSMGGFHKQDGSPCTVVIIFVALFKSIRARCGKELPTIKPGVV